MASADLEGLRRRFTGSAAPTSNPIESRRCYGHYNRPFFVEITSLLRLGHHRPIVENDIVATPTGKTVAQAARVLEEHFKRNSKQWGDLRLAYAWYATFQSEIFYTGLSHFCASTFTIVGAFTLRFLLTEADGTSNGSKRAVGALFGIIIMYAIASLGDTIRVYRAQLLRSKTRAVLTTVIHNKSLRISARARHTNRIDVGRIMNLINSDTERLSDAMLRLHGCWVPPIALAISLVLLCINIGYSALPGIGLQLAVGIPLAFASGKRSQQYQKQADIVVRSRSSITEQVVTGITFIKLHVWEPWFADRIFKFRSIESFYLTRLTWWNTGYHGFMRGIGNLCPMISLLVFRATGHTLEASIIFSTLAIFQANFWVLSGFPVALRDVGQARLSHDLLQAFLLLEEPDSLNRVQGPQVALENASFTFEAEPDTTPFAFTGLNISFRPGITAVVGPVGSGKSALLAALAGEMRRRYGKVVMPSAPAHCAQTPWIRNATMRENITFGHPFDAALYDQVVDACALRRDIDSLPDGDRSEIGERGVILSGGQQQRVNLARAFYANTEVLLADDPLSAVDASIGRHIFAQAIRGLGAGKTTIMATHQLHVLEECDYILWMSDAGIRKHGTFEELMQDPDFCAFVGKYEQSESQQPAEEEGPQSSRSHELDPTLGRLMEEEERAYNAVRFRTAIKYFTSGSFRLSVYLLALVVLCEGAVVATGLWLAYWVDMRFRNLSNGQYIAILLGLTSVACVLTVMYGLMTVEVSNRGSNTLFKNAAKGIFRAPATFFHSQPAGRILSRFQSDVLSLDREGGLQLKILAADITALLFLLGLTTAYYPYFAAILVPLYVGFTFMLKFKQRTSRELQRMSIIRKNNAVSLVQEACSGVQALKQYNRLDMFDNEIANELESCHSLQRLEFATMAWTYCLLDITNLVLMFITGIFIVFANEVQTASAIKGVILTTSVNIFVIGHRMCYCWSATEICLHACERLTHYAEDIPHEAALTSTADEKLPPSWPRQGKITFEAVSMRYRPGLPLALENINLEVKSGENVGIIGRTGCGKSSLLKALFRLHELDEGRILVDGVDVSTLGLAKLRSSLSIIPQDPLLLEGTVRSNIDPEQRCSERELNYFLDQATNPEEVDGRYPGPVVVRDVDEPGPRSNSQRLMLDSIIEAEGKNLSKGQRQQISLVRALLRSTQTVVLDEATSSIDTSLDMLLQARLQRLLKYQTVISIAHRLKTVIGFDKIAVMSEGKIIEFDEPVRLWESKGEFYQTCLKAGVSKEEVIAAREAAALYAT